MRMRRMTRGREESVYLVLPPSPSAKSHRTQPSPMAQFDNDRVRVDSVSAEFKTMNVGPFMWSYYGPHHGWKKPK